jgi:hypothetical protein
MRSAIFSASVFGPGPTSTPIAPASCTAVRRSREEIFVSAHSAHLPARSSFASASLSASPQYTTFPAAVAVVTPLDEKA